MSNNTICKVKNRSAGMVVYRIPELGIRREFAPGEEKKIAWDELEKLSYQSGGRELMYHFLQVQSQKVLNDLGIKTEPEYNMNEQQVADLLEKGSLDAFLDCLDFAPMGVIDLVKRLAVALPLNDSQKRDALKEKTGFDVSAALANLKAEQEEDKAPATAAPERRVKEEVKPAGRRTSGSNYKVVETKEETVK